MKEDFEIESYVASTRTTLAPHIAAAIRATLADLAEEIVRAIQHEVPGYARPLRGDFGRGIRTGVELALSRFVGDEQSDSAAVYRSLGYGELTAGRTLDSLQSAYRVGARVAWRRMSEAAAGSGATADEQRELAEAMFAYIEQIAAESIEGYANAQLAQAGDLDRRRSALFGLLTGAAPLDRTALAAAAAQARWTLPDSVACIAIENDAAAAMLRRLSGETLRGEVGGWTGIVVADPSRVEHEARTAARRLGVVVALGPPVDVAQARVSMRWACLARELPCSAAGLVVAEQRLADIALRAAPELVEALAVRALAPLAQESERSRARLQDTLHAWLRHHGSQRAAAVELGVHPQTVRYRLGRLRELFGAKLEDADSRFALQAALRARALAREAGAAHAVGGGERAETP
jgi:hypothetical protein